MQLLKSVSSLAAAKELVAFLKSHGILAFIANDKITAISPEKGFIGLVNVGVWVVLEYQYDDAVALLTDPRHVVQQPLTSQEMAVMQRDSKPPYTQAVKRVIKFAVVIFIGVTLLCVAGYLLRT